MAKTPSTKAAHRAASLPPNEGVVPTLESLAKNITWRGELTAEQSSELLKRTNDQTELGLIDLFSAPPVEGGERFVALVGRLNDNLLTPPLIKRLGSRLAHHQQWDALFDLSRLVGVRKLKVEIESAPSELRSRFAVTSLSSERLATDDPITLRQIKRDSAILTTWATGEDAATLASAFLSFAMSALPKSKFSIAKFAARSIALTIPEDAVISALDSGKFSSLQLATLVDLVAKTPQGAKYVQSFIVRISRSQRSETLENERCWQRITLLEIAQLTKYPEVMRHLSGQPAWWTARQRRELTDEGVGSILRFIDGARRAREVVDTNLLGEFLRDAKRAGNLLIREAFDSVVTAALAEQSMAHDLSLADTRAVVTEREAALETARAEQAQLQARILRLEENLLMMERSEIQSRDQKDAMAQRGMIDLIVELLRAMERLNESAGEVAQVRAFVAEAEALIARANISVERSSDGRLVPIRKVDINKKDTGPYPES
jgi:hypothetical protein